MLLALTRPVSPSLANCELTHLAREPINIPLAIAQHIVYENTLRSLGVQVIQVPAAPEFPDSVFIEDTALVLDEVAVITRPAQNPAAEKPPPSPKSSANTVHSCTSPPPATLDGGDVLVVERTIYVGISSRSNNAAVGQLQQMLNAYAYTVHAVQVEGCLHLKSAVTAIGEKTLLINPQWLPAELRTTLFAGYDLIPIHPAESYAANALLIQANLGQTLIYPTHFPRTRDLLLKKNFHLTLVDNTELAKAEGAVTCCSLLLNNP